MNKIQKKLIRGVSNKTTTFVLLFFLVVSVGSTLFSLNKLKVEYVPGISGYATDSGTVDIDVLGFTSLTVASSVDFGQGAIGTSGNETILTTETWHAGNLAYQNTSFNNCSNSVNWSNVSYECRGIEVNNNGNVNINITISAAQDANSFWLGNNATDEFYYATLNGNRSHNETSSCNINQNLNGTSFANATTLPGGSNWTNITLFSYNWSTVPVAAAIICTNLTTTTGANAITVEFNITIPANEPVTSKQNSFTFTAEQI
ncbi:hypothetical protein HQ529_05880 [Candidatus Woesearchaeota archaeon]|nr:hypothetical protein [Candidatus Woesearchaeota archaeon]